MAPDKFKNPLRVLDLTVLKYAMYQRPLEVKRVEAIASAFNHTSVGFPLVSNREGEFWVVDGQHRIHVLLSLGIKVWPCEVLTGQSYQEEAAEWIRRNSGKKPHPVYDFVAKYEAGDAEAIDIVDIVAASGWNPPRSGGVRNTQINSVKAMIASYRIGRQHFKDAMLILHQAWPGNYKATSPFIIKGLTRFLAVYWPDVDHGALTKRLAAYPGGPINFIADARRSFGATVDELVTDALVDIYNRGRKHKLARR